MISDTGKQADEDLAKQNNKDNSEERIISKHIFLFPFTFDLKYKKDICDTPFSKRTDINKVRSLLGSNWLKDANNKESWDFTNHNYKEEKKLHVEKSEDEKRASEVKKNFHYNYSRYFYDNVKKAMNAEDDKNPAVYNYKYKVEAGDTYNISIVTDFSKIGDGVHKKLFQLQIEEICLKLYDTGIGILSFNLNNCNENSTPEDILMINDWGRRVYPQFLPFYLVKEKMLADKITLNLKCREPIEEDFEQKYDTETTYISKTIMDLLGEKFKYDCRLCKKGDVFIKPIIDDRMYTISFYMDGKVSNALSSSTIQGYTWQSDEYWSKYIFIDGEYSTCQSNIMLREFIDMSTYHRWTHYGTLYGVTRFSFVGIAETGEFSRDVLLNHVRYLYYEMVCLALAQRASILRFSEEATQVAAIDTSNRGIFNNKNDIALKHIKDLQLKYIHFINRLYFREVTAQEQGIELYELMINSMQIERDISRLDGEIDELHRYALLSSEDKTNTMLTILTIVGTVVAALGFTTSFFGMNVNNGALPLIGNYHNLRTWSVSYLLLPIILMLIFMAIFYVLLNKCSKKKLYSIILVVLIIGFAILKLFIK